MKIKPYYHTSTDIAFYFRDKESIQNLLFHIVKEAHAFADEIDKNGNQIPYPIIINDVGNLAEYQIDYQFMIHAIADYISKETNDRNNRKKVINGFAILASNVNKINADGKKKVSKTMQDINRVFLTFLMETHNNITTLGNYNRNIKMQAHYMDKLIKYNELYVNFKEIGRAHV